MSNLDQYIQALDQYYILIDTTKWADGSRDDLVRKMDFLWGQMGKPDRQKAMEYSCRVYERRISGT